MNYSDFGQAFLRPSPIVDLMDDLGEALNNNPDILFLGGGNPAQIPSVQALFSRHLRALVNDENTCNRVLGVYQSPRGQEQTIARLCEYFQRDCGWPVESENIALLNGSQSAMFILLNLFAGRFDRGPSQRRIALPLVPEYLGYSSQGLLENHFDVFQPEVQLSGPNRFKYRIQFDDFVVHETTGAVCVSRPTNPSGNLLEDRELEALHQICLDKGTPLIVDLAYGAPFPGVVYRSCESPWRSGMIYVMSMSKLGLPGVRSSVVIADPDTIATLVKINTTMNLANGNLGPEIMARLLVSRDLQRLSHDLLPNFYARQRDILIQLLEHYLKDVAYRIHEPEGAFFIWLWFPNLPVTSRQLYQALKDRGVLVMAGEPFFYGLEKHWPHAKQCLRLTYCQPQAKLESAVNILAQVLRHPG